MIFLPIVGRELRVASRKPGTYRLRTGVALGAILLGVALFIASTFSLPVNLGKQLFWALSGLAMLYCLVAGRFATADSLSEEKREGTLGLLFLTDLKGYDVVLGKLAANSITSFYCLLAVMPVVALPLLVGGITSAEYWRVFLVLIVTILFSLAIGIFGSTICRDRRAAMGVNLLLLLVFVAGLPAIGGAIFYFLPPHLFNPGFLFTCPVYAFVLANDIPYGTNGGEFWLTLFLVHGLTWLLIVLACLIAPRSWQDRPAPPVRGFKSRWLELWEAFSHGARAKRPAYRRRLLDVNAFYWLAARARLRAHHVWIFLGFMAQWWVVVTWINGEWSFQETIAFTTALILNSTLKIWIAIEAGQRLAEDRKMGALELVLCTRMNVRDIIRGQWLALRRQFLRPLLFATAVELLFMLVVWHQFHAAQTLVFWLTCLVVLFADAFALGWVGMSAALTARSHNNATLATMFRVLLLPWLAGGVTLLAIWFGSEMFSDNEWLPGWKSLLACWAGFGLAADVLFGVLARRNLLRNFRTLALAHYAPAPSLLTRLLARPPTPQAEPSAEGLSATGAATTRARPKKSRRVLWPAAIALVILAVSGVWVWNMLFPKPPPPVTVAVAQNPALLRVYPTQRGAFFILPDGSLWRWGQPEGPQSTHAPAPEQIGTNRDWMSLSYFAGHTLGVRSNGTLWEWRGSSQFSGIQAVQVNEDRDWVGASAGISFALARKRDGTLWGWGDNRQHQLGLEATPSVSNPLQIGTNHDWLDVSAYINHSLGLRADGTLWVWGSVARQRGTNYVRPTQVGEATDWVGLIHDTSSLPMAHNQAGELWDPLYTTPATNQTAPLILTGRLMATNAFSDRLAEGMRSEPMPDIARFVIHPDGTLWSTPFHFYPVSGAPPAYAGGWQVFGSRSDWISVWGVYGTMFGLTSDGTLWMWGIDAVRPPDFQFRLAQLRQRLADRFGSSPRPGSGSSAPMQKTPRPILRLVPEK